MAQYTRRFRGAPGCCTRSALGQIDPGEMTATFTPEVEGGAPRLPLGQLFAVSVAAGLSVFVLSKLLSGKDR